MEKQLTKPLQRSMLRAKAGDGLLWDEKTAAVGKDEKAVCA